ncbi:transglycosylase domain-containing protein [Actinocorallia longicatena]|uniref:Penicillin-insensitive transglycosylase n=1 Tax=Actinocorallia longicatena TaxID=111803 RepID=A0ABP6Q9B2_9ACTN
MSYPPYGPDNGPSGNLPEDDWFRPAPNAREEIYRESEYGRPQQPPQGQAYNSHADDPYGQDPYGQDAYGYDEPGGWNNDAYGAGQGNDHVASHAQPAPGGPGQQGPGQPGPGQPPFGQPAFGQPGPGPQGSGQYGQVGQPAHGAPGGYYDDDPFADAFAPATSLDAMGGGGPVGPGAPGGGDGEGGRRGRGKAKKTGWKRYIPDWKIIVGVFALGVVGVGIMIFVGYSTTKMPSLDEFQKDVTAQGSTVYVKGKNGKYVEAFRLGVPRQNVKLEQVPEVLQQAVMAAEQREFLNEPGVSPKGLSRAVFKTLTGGQVQGGSTITQQVARNYFKGLSQERSLSRKYKEIFIAIKLDKELSKQQILELYLNTIYYGRSADGIQAASRAYFCQDVGQINTPAKAALLATVLNRPDWFHTVGSPKTDPQRAATEERWNYVLNGMVEKGWITKEVRDQQKFPKTIENGSCQQDKGQDTYIRDQIYRDLEKINMTEEEVSKGGYKIYTSIDLKLMKYARDSVKANAPHPLEKNARIGLVTMDPQTGAVVSFYGGDPTKTKKKGGPDKDSAFFDQAQVGSSFKPYVLAAALKAGNNINSVIDARSPICLNYDTGDALPAYRSETACQGTVHPGGVTGYWMRSTHGTKGATTLKNALAQSYNTSFVRLARKIGSDKVVETAEALGVPKAGIPAKDGDRYVASLPLGVAPFPAVYQATGYSAFANGGYPVIPHIITKVTNGTTTKKMPWGKKRPRYLSEDQSAQITEALRSVVTGGTGGAARLASGQPVAGKTGTTDDGKALWFVGYSPQLVTASTMYGEGNTKILGGNEFGGGPPTKIWQSFMTKALASKKIEQFPVPKYDGLRTIWDKITPKTTKATPTCDPNTMINGKCPAPGDGNQHKKPGCGQFDPPILCDPTVPPPGQEQNPPQWFCDKNPQYPTCARDGGQGNPGDADGDGVPDAQDPDVDGDGIPNEMDPDYQKPGNNGNGGGNPNGGRIPTSWSTTPRDESLGD